MSVSPGRTMARALAVLFPVLLLSHVAPASVPVPPFCGCELSGQVLPCQYRFIADGSYDTLSVHITLRNEFGDPVDRCPTSATLVPTAGTLAFCSCCPNPQLGESGPDGVVVFEFARIGGRGELAIEVTAHAIPDVPICTKTIHFTSPDMIATCNASASTTIQSLGIWASGMIPYQMYSDYNCDLTVNILDLGIWAGGLDKGCLVPNPSCPY